MWPSSMAHCIWTWAFSLTPSLSNVTVQWWRNDSFGTDCRCRIGSESCKRIATCNMPPFYLWTCNNPCNSIFLFRKKSLLVFLTSFSVVIRVIITSYFLMLWITSSCVRTALLCEIIPLLSYYLVRAWNTWMLKPGNQKQTSLRGRAGKSRV